MGDPHGKAILRAFITTDITKGQVIAPIHWTGETAPSARVNAVAAATDPVSGQPESTVPVVNTARFNATWRGFAVSDGE